MPISDQIIEFYKSLNPPELPNSSIQILNPYQNKDTMGIVNEFYRKYYFDTEKRVMLIGINPGRHGGGITGIPFTDPINLEKHCGIDNSLEKRHELSSKFIYRMIESLGGATWFYSKYFISAVSPLGFVMDGKNLNYYDNKELELEWENFFVDCFKTQFEFGIDRSVAYSLGQGKNIKYLQYLNSKYKLFDEVKALPHPRWIMQYRLKRIDEFIDIYREALKK